MTAAVLALMLIGAVSIRGVHSQSLRLYYYSNDSLAYGRLEIYDMNEWIPFTITNFNMHSADLACRSLGFAFASRYTTAGALRLSQSNSSNFAYILLCSFQANSFSSCSYFKQISDSHYADVVLLCTNSSSSLRLISTSGDIGGPFGRLQIFINNTWGTVCNDNFRSLEAKIACNQLGYKFYFTHYRATNMYTSFSLGPVWLDMLINCNSSSTDLRDCAESVGRHGCSHFEDVILYCYNDSSTTNFPSDKVLRLVYNGHIYPIMSGGRLELFFSNSIGKLSWMPFCYNGFSRSAADIACRQLGFTRASFSGTVRRLGFRSSPSNNSISSITCLQSDTDLRYCSLQTSSPGCSPSDQVAVRCSSSSITPSINVGLIVGSVFGSLTFISCCFVGILMCVVVKTVVSRQKTMRRVRTINVAQNLPNYPMSNITAQENVIIPTPAPPYTPNPLPSGVLQQMDPVPQMGETTFSTDDTAANREGKKDHLEDLYTPADIKDLTT